MTYLTAYVTAYLTHLTKNAAELKWYSDLKAELRKYEIPIDDISRFAKTVNEIRQRGYDAGKVIGEFSDFESLGTRHQRFQDSVQMLKNEFNSLSQQCTSLENMVNSHNQTISMYKKLEAIGFSLKELSIFWHTINEIAVANNIPLNEAPQKFYKDIEEQYDDKIGFESKVENLRAEVNRLNQEQSRLSAQLFVQPLVSPVLIRLIQSGVKEQDIINVAHIFNTHSGDYRTVKPRNR